MNMHSSFQGFQRKSVKYYNGCVLKIVVYSYLRYYREVGVNIGEARDLHQHVCYTVNLRPRYVVSTPMVKMSRHGERYMLYDKLKTKIIRPTKPCSLSKPFSPVM